MASITKTVANAATRFAARLELYNDPNNAEARLKAFPGYGNTTTGLATLISSGRVGGAGGVDFGRVCGNLVDNSIVDICTSFIGQKGVEAPAIAQTWNATSKAWEAAPSHPLQALLDTPNPLFAGTQLFAATYISLCRGNSYFIMVRNNLGNKIAELWWAPHYSGEWHSQAYGMMPWVPPGSQDGLPTCYRYFVRGKGFFIPLEDVVHFRRAKSDPRNPFIGLDPLLAQRSQVATDNEICQYNYSILHNMGIPGAAYSPKEGIVYDINGKAQFKESNKAAITGAKRGDPIILDESYDVTYPNVNPQRMALDTIGNMSEERIPASLGLNAVALQLGAGLDQSHFSTMREAMKWAWDNGISPLHQIIHECASQKIVPAYKATPQQLRIWFPYDNVPCLQEDENLKWTRWISLFEANGVKRSVLLSNLGLELPDGDKDGYVSDLTPPPAPFGGDAKIPVPKLNSAVYMRALPSPQHYKAGATESQVADYIASLPKSA